MTTKPTKRGRGGSQGLNSQPTSPDTASDRSARSEAASGNAVAQLAHELFLKRGGAHGHDLDDWFEAERRLRSQAA